MCGAPVFPAIPTRFVYNDYKPLAAADVVTDVVGSLAPSTPSAGFSSWPEPAAKYAAPKLSPAAQQQQQQLTAEAAWGLLLAAAAAAQQMARPRSKAKAATCGGGCAPAPPPIKMRFVPKIAPAPDVIDAGSSAPSTPSGCSPLETTPSPRGPPLPPSLPDSPAAAASGVATKPPLLAPPVPSPRVEVRQVWAHNFDREARLIESLMPDFRYAAVDTEFPGTVYRPAGPVHSLKPHERYKLLRSNVHALDVIQLGLTLFDEGCRLPCLGVGGGGDTRYVWEFNFREFDVHRHHHAPESIAMLRSKGVDFDITRHHGVDAAAFGPRLRKWMRAGLGRAGIVTFCGGYDLAYMVKMIFGPGFEMPGLAEQFEVIAKALLRRRVFDVKEMARLCPANLRGGLDTLAVKLDVPRAVGEAHQAGSDSLLTCHAFMKLREIYFDEDGKLTRVAGILSDITAF